MAQQKLYTENDLIDLVQSLKDYTHESHTILGHDERDAKEFVDIFLKDRTPIELPSDEEIENKGKQTIAQQIKWNFAKEGDLVIRNAEGNRIYIENSNEFWSKSKYDEKGNCIYYEDSDGYWSKSKYDEKGNEIYYENSNGFWYKRKYDEKGNPIYHEESDGFWSKREFDEKSNQIYYKNSYGQVIDKRPKCDKVVEIDGVKYKLVKL